MSGYNKYNGLDYRPKFSSSEKGRAREAHYVLNNLFRTKTRKSNVTLEDLIACSELLLGLVVLIVWGICKLVVLLYKRTKAMIMRYREERRVQDKEMKVIKT